MRKVAICFALVIFAISTFGGVAAAKDLTHRISAGYNKQLSFGFLGDNVSNQILGIDSFAVKYWATEDIGVEAFFGYFTAEFDEIGGWGADLGGKFYYNVIKEENMNLYTGGGLGIIPVHLDYGTEDETNTGFQIMGYGGIEFFLDGLPNLGFDMEVGIQYLSVGEYRQLNTYGGAFSTFGIRYYF